MFNLLLQFTNLNDQRNIANPLKTLDSKLMINNQINDNLAA
jgi:type I restriction enzyme S subunit